MNSIQSTDYFVHFDEVAYQKLNAYLTAQKLSAIFLLVDENTSKHCFPLFIKQIESNITIHKIEVNSGEIHKNITTCVFVWEQLTTLGADRNSILINLGGGMVTDLGGFVASTFKRGIKFINIPTTILSMVDASVGSKTGVDLGHLKNLIGLFSNPEMVLIDSDYLNTLSRRETRSGIAEMIKYGLTFDIKLLNDIKDDKWYGINELNTLIYKSISIKNTVVLKDIKETHLRKVLNFGHTVGHAVESFFLSKESLNSLTHGEAIAIGMVVESYLSYKLFSFPKKDLESLKQYIHKVYDKVHIPKENYFDIADIMKHDKKNVDGKINYVLLKNISDFEIDVTVSSDLVIEGFEYYQK